jgi:nitroreductase
MIRDLILKNRSYRRFHQEVDIKRETLRELVDLARLSPSARNAQPLKYILSCEPQRNSLIFPHLAWAGYIKGWSGPCEGERPSAYIIILGDTEIRQSFGCDHGVAAQSSGDTKYWRDSNGVHHVPKRPLDDIIIG